MTVRAAAQGAEAVSAEIDWLHELTLGGGTGVVLFGLLFLLVTLVVERIVNLRRRHIVPRGFVQSVLPLWGEGRFDDLRECCEQHPSTLARMTAFLVENRAAPAELLIQGAADIGTREILDEQRRNYLLSVIAGLAPLLGLLGTIIGMIESFKLVEIYGDAGGATILAGSISKALITTALGLIIGIPALGIYHGFKYKVQGLGRILDEQMEALINAWLLKSMPVAGEGAPAAPGRAGSSAEAGVITFYCPGCRQKLKADASMSGQSIACPRCAEQLTVPAASPDR